MSVYDLNVLEWEIKNVVKLLLMREVVICNNIIFCIIYFVRWVNWGYSEKRGGGGEWSESRSCGLLF